MLAHEKWVLVEEAFPEQFLNDLASLFHEEQSLFRPARIGAADQQKQESGIRGDQILWMDPQKESHHQVHEKIHALKEELREGMRLGLDDFECHLAMYPPGAGYAEHIDQSSSRSLNTTQRVLSFVLYLNRDWSPDRGGELVLRLPEKSHVILPTWNRLVVFSSTDLPHRVEKSYSARRSLTGWMRRCSNPFHGERPSQLPAYT
jgi:SM-20-related protein